MSRAPLRVAVLGAGTVGREVIRGLMERADPLCAAAGRPLILAGVACRDLERAAWSGVPHDLLTDAPAHLVADPGIDVIVEVMGGDEPARTLVAAALGAGKPVVTANKHVVAFHGPELESAARRFDVPFRFEAAVAGGIPVLGPLAADLAANDVIRVRGIVNGTTNYILSAMARDGRSYRDVLTEAQALGYAEADPAGDVEGDDAVNKAVIIARLAFGRWLDPSTVTRRPPSVRGHGAPGITGVTDSELAGAAALGLTIKLLATAERRGGAADEPAIGVLPSAVPADDPLGRTSGVTNRVEIEARPVGVVAFSGPGAGGEATSSAILGDLVAIARSRTSTWAGLPPADGPAGSGADPLGERAWFAFVPPDRRAAARVRAMPGASIAELADGKAIRTPRLALDAARAEIGAYLQDGADVPLYPIDD
jgi:homoserine dehydrogenase